jgi:hypothetical protein
MGVTIGGARRSRDIDLTKQPATAPEGPAQKACMRVATAAGIGPKHVTA